MKILLLEDDGQIAENINLLLGRESYVVRQVGTIDEAMECWQSGEYDLIICDRRLPDGDGIEFVKNIRVEDNLTPVLMLTAKTQKNDIIEGLDHGADDYLSKPFEAEVLLARIRALLRRRKKTVSKPIVEIGEIEIDTNRHVVSRRNKVVALSPKEYALLEYLLAHKERIVERVEILAHVWDDEIDLFSNTVDVHIRYLRQKLGNQIVTTVRGKGYQLCIKN